MKRITPALRNISLALFIASAAFFISSCQSQSEKLAEEIAGTWSSAPEQITTSGATRTTMVRVMDFTRTASDATDGAVTMTALITVDNVMPASGKLDTPLTITASGAATITGAFQVKDHDDILISLDYSSLQVSVDPAAVQINYNILTQDASPEVESLRPGALHLATQQIRQAATSVFSNLTEVEDVKIHTDLLSCEIAHKDLSFRRQQPQ